MGAGRAGGSSCDAACRPVVGRLSVSLRARPVASSLTLIGTRGSLTCDFVRSIVVGAANPGTEALEKISNPMIEGDAARGADGVQRLSAGFAAAQLSGTGRAHRRVLPGRRSGDPSPVSPAHLAARHALFDSSSTRIARRRAAASASADRAGASTPRRSVV